MKRKEIEHYLRIVFITTHCHFGENEDLSLVLTKSQKEIQYDLKQLEKEGYIHLEHSYPQLTEKGLEIAKKLYKKHELFEGFFKNILKLSHKEAHKLSDVLEHVSSKEFESKIQEFLSIRQFIPLTFLKKGEKGRFVRVEGSRRAMRRLHELGFVGDVDIFVKMDASFRGPMKVSVRDTDITLGYRQARKIIVEIYSGEKLPLVRGIRTHPIRRRWGRRTRGPHFR